MNENNEFEYTVAKKSEGKYRLYRVLMIFGYILFGAGYFFGLALAHLYPIMAFTPLLIWILVFFTWRFVSIEYRYEAVSGGIRFYKVFGCKKKKLLIEKRIKEFSCIKPYDEDGKADIANEKFVVRHMCVRSEKDASDCFYAIYDTEGGKGIVIFEATQSALKILRFYNSNTVLAQTRY